MAQTHVASHSSDDHRRTTAGKIWPLALGSIGVAYGDIGTSPLYAFKEATGHAMAHGLTGSAAVLGGFALLLAGCGDNRESSFKKVASEKEAGLKRLT